MDRDRGHRGAASFALLLLRVDYSGMISELGAEFTQVWARQCGGEVTLAGGAVRVVQTMEEATK